MTVPLRIGWERNVGLLAGNPRLAPHLLISGSHVGHGGDDGQAGSLELDDDVVDRLYRHRGVQVVVERLLPRSAEPSDHQQLHLAGSERPVRHLVVAPPAVEGDLVKADDAETVPCAHALDGDSQDVLGTLDDALGEAETSRPQRQGGDRRQRVVHHPLEVEVGLAADAPQPHCHSDLLRGPVMVDAGLQTPDLLPADGPSVLQLGDRRGLPLEAPVLGQERRLLPAPPQPPGLKEHLLLLHFLLQHLKLLRRFAALSASEAETKGSTLLILEQLMFSSHYILLL